MNAQDQEIATTILRCYQAQFEHLRAAIDVVADDSALIFDCVKSRLFQKGQRMTQWFPTSKVLISTTEVQTRTICAHCSKRSHHEAWCRQNYPHLFAKIKIEGMIADQKRSAEQLLTEAHASHNDEYVCLQRAHVHKLPLKCYFGSSWTISSGATTHMTFNR